MSFPDMLVRVSPDAPSEPDRLAIAVDLAIRVHGRLIGLFVDDLSGAADEALALFRGAADRTPLETGWRVVDGATVDGLMSLARRSDLTILPQAASCPQEWAPQALAIAAGRPVLILPPPMALESIGHRVIVAWNDTRECARAVHDAMPLLANAELVIVLSVRAFDGPALISDRLLLDHLRQHGVRATLHDRRDDDVAAAIGAEAIDQNADLIVLGVREQPAPRTSDAVGWRFAQTAATPVFLSN